ncbi:MAG: trehalose-6-phosphate synthase [Beijerinckiaceae bacterium]
MNRLVVVSNRVADISNPNQAGGLAVGLGDALTDRGGIWFGWDGNVVKQGTRVAPSIAENKSVTTITLPMTAKDYEEYYAGFSNGVLWPVFHYRLDLERYEDAYLKGYRRVNSKFADALTPFLKSDDLIWIHDYHLIPLATELRRRGCKQRIGFFLHIPFPPMDILAAAPHHEWLTSCLLDYDVIGFQTNADLTNFRHYIVDRMKGQWFEGGAIAAQKKSATAKAFPIGINVEAFRAMSRTNEADEQIALLQRRLTARTHVIGVERLDYTKGLPARLKAFGRLLEKYPENIKHVSLMQIASPSREQVEAYVDIKEELEALSGQINGAYADFDWTPVRYMNRAVPRNILAALFRGSQVGLVTPLRDGMNLVAKEYVAAQDDDNPGVLILSKFAGAAEQMSEALLINPYNVDEMSDTLQRAIRMPLQERKERQAALLAKITQFDARQWQQSFLGVLGSARLNLVA